MNWLAMKCFLGELNKAVKISRSTSRRDIEWRGWGNGLANANDDAFLKHCAWGVLQLGVGPLFFNCVSFCVVK